MNEKLTVLSVNGESYDIWDENAVKIYYFADLHSAVTAMNTDTFTGEKPETEKVSVIRYGPGAYRTDLLNDLTECQAMELTANMDLHLNGKTLTFNISENSNYGMKISGNTVCTVDGQIPGSTIHRVIEATDVEVKPRFTMLMAGKKMVLNGGTYSISGLAVETKGTAVVTALTGSVELNGCNFFNDGINSGTHCCVQFSVDVNAQVKDCTFTANSPNDAHIAIAYYGNGGTHEMDRCSVIVTGGYGVAVLNGTLRMKDTVVQVAGQNDGGTGVYAANSTVRMDNTNILTTGQTSGGMGVYMDSSTLKALGTTVICNGPINYGVGIYLANTTADLDNCYTNAGHTGIDVRPGSNAYIRGGIIGGFTHGLYCTHSSDGEVFVRDATLRCRYNADMPLCVDTPEVYKCCCYIGLYDDLGQTVHFDGCTFMSGNDERAIDEAMVLRAGNTQETDTAACLSNCVIALSNPSPFRLEAGKSAVHIGSNTVDGTGNSITQSFVHSGTGGVDSVPENLHVTGMLYRKLAEHETCTGKDIQVFMDYSAPLLEGV